MRTVLMFVDWLRLQGRRIREFLKISPFRDCTQYGIECEGVFKPSDWELNTLLPVVTGTTRVYVRYRPIRAIVTETLIVTFENPEKKLPPIQRAVEVSDNGDVILVAAWSGAKNCFPCAPSQANGISGQAFAYDALGGGLSWPVFDANVDTMAKFAIKKTALLRVQPPEGYGVEDIAQVRVIVRLNLFGHSL